MDLPEDVRPLLDRVVAGFRAILADNLVGIYLHGSLAMGEFNPLTSDVDLLVVVRDPLDLDAKRALSTLTLELAPDGTAEGAGTQRRAAARHAALRASDSVRVPRLAVLVRRAAREQRWI